MEEAGKIHCLEGWWYAVITIVVFGVFGSLHEISIRAFYRWHLAFHEFPPRTFVQELSRWPEKFIVLRKVNTSRCRFTIPNAHKLAFANVPNSQIGFANNSFQSVKIMNHSPHNTKMIFIHPPPVLYGDSSHSGLVKELMIESLATF